MDLKDIIIREGAKQFALKGYNETKVSSILKNCNISVGTFYNVFDSKYELLIYIIQVHFEYFIAFISQLNSKDISFEEKIELLMDHSIPEDEHSFNTALVVAREVFILYTKPKAILSELYQEMIRQFEILLQPYIQNNQLITSNINTLLGLFISLAYYGNRRIANCKIDIRRELYEFYISGIFKH